MHGKTLFYLYTVINKTLKYNYFLSNPRESSIDFCPKECKIEKWFQLWNKFYSLIWLNFEDNLNTYSFGTGIWWFVRISTYICYYLYNSILYGVMALATCTCTILHINQLNNCRCPTNALTCTLFFFCRKYACSET